MLIIVVASLTVTQFARQRSIFLTTLNAVGLQYPPDPASQHLMRAGAAGLMTRNLARVPRSVTVRDLRSALASSPTWLVIEENGALARRTQRHRSRRPPRCPGQRSCPPATPDEPVPDDDSQQFDPRLDAEVIDLMEVPGMRKDAGVIHNRATLLEALAEIPLHRRRGAVRRPRRDRRRSRRRPHPRRHRTATHKHPHDRLTGRDLP